MLKRVINMRLGVGRAEQFEVNSHNLELLADDAHSCWFKGLKELCRYVSPIETMLEVGVYQGESTCLFRYWLMPTRMYCVDPWQNGYDDSDAASTVFKMEDVENNFDHRVAQIRAMASTQTDIIKIKQKSNVAHKLLLDNSLDMVYIDANHQYEAIKEDIELWKPKVKKGGYIAGHDWGREGVVNAVRELLGEPNKTFQDSSWVVCL